MNFNIKPVDNSNYKKIGFIFNGEVDINGEKVMVINLSKTVLKDD